MNKISHAERNAIWDEFIRTWPKSRVETMTLAEYTTAGNKDSFTNWIEGRTEELGSIWGGSAFKFGIYHMNPDRTDKEYAVGSMYQSDGVYAWYGKIGNSRDEVFRITRDRILAVINAVQADRLEDIGPLPLGRVVKWKIASLYQDRINLPVIPIFSKDALKYVVDHGNDRASTAELQRRAREQRGDQDYWTFYDVKIKKWLDYQALLPKVEKRGDGDPDLDIESPQLPRYWFYAPGEGGENWDKFHSDGVMAIGWDYLGDLSQYPTKEEIGKVMREHDNEPDNSKKNNANSCFAFGNLMKPGDTVFAKVGMSRIVGMGKIKSDYQFDPGRPFFHHVRKVDWQVKGNWTSERKFPFKTVTEITDNKDLVEYLLGLVSDTITVADKGIPYLADEYGMDSLREETGYPQSKLEEWLLAIDRKKQVVFFGPPGTGKTYLAERLARNMISGTDGFIDSIQFHPSYTYEEFIQGIRPEADEKGNLQFELKSGRFMDFCMKAKGREGPCVLIIDELNRANLSRVFGELMFLLEYRNKEIVLAGGSKLSIPENVRILATMNTADRSIALVDFALRRRFSFLELAPEYEILRDFHRKHDFDAGALIKVLNSVNTKIDDKNFHLGISFFMSRQIRRDLEQIWKLEIETYLEEYFFGQPSSIADYRWDKVKDRILA